jgi:DNA-binding protein HU-beta
LILFTGAYPINVINNIRSVSEVAVIYCATSNPVQVIVGKVGDGRSVTRPVTLKHLAASLAEQHELTKRQGETLLNDLVGLITKHLKKGERIRIAGFGILQVRKRPARMGRNPATGEAIRIKASKKVAFRAAKELKLACSLG